MDTMNAALKAPLDTRPVEALVRSFGLSDPRHVERAVAAALAGLPQRARSADAVASHARGRIADWLAAALDSDDPDDGRLIALGRAAFLAIDGPRRWGGRFLAEDELPEPFVHALRRAAPRPRPPERPAAMPDQPLDPMTPVVALARMVFRRPRRNPARHSA